jgi:hypothetical protein
MQQIYIALNWPPEVQRVNMLPNRVNVWLVRRTATVKVCYGHGARSAIAQGLLHQRRSSKEHLWQVKQDTRGLRLLPQDGCKRAAHGATDINHAAEPPKVVVCEHSLHACEQWHARRQTRSNWSQSCTDAIQSVCTDRRPQETQLGCWLTKVVH